MKQLFIFCLFLFLIAPLSNAEETRATSILLDVSRSVSKQEFEKIKTTVQQWLDQEDSSDPLSLYIFGTNVKKIGHDQLKTVKATESYTLLYDAAYDAMQDLTQCVADKKTLLIFSDGNDTKSVTTVEDIVSFAKTEGIAIDCVGFGKANRKLLERISKLTGGKFFSADETELIAKINTAVEDQKAFKVEALKQSEFPKKLAIVPAATSVVIPIPDQSETSYLRMAAIFAGILLLGITAYAVIRRKNQIRVCPACDRQLESYQTTCPECPGQTKIMAVPQFVPEDTSEIERQQESPPAEWFQIKQDTQEIMMKTFYLAESPVLVVTKGTSSGESYQLSKEVPVSIGRSRVNEIRPLDGSISAQHCRIIPENGKHVLYDLGSTNGTLLNNKKVSKAILKEGGTIGVGETVLQYKIEHSR